MSNIPSPALAKLSTTQQELVSAAAGRPDCAVILPARLKGLAAGKVIEALLGKGLVREIRAKGDLPVWRVETETGRRYSLVLTKAGRSMAGPVGEAPCPAQSTGNAADTGMTAADVAMARAEGAMVTPRSGSKLAAVLTLLGRDQGSSVAELMSATGWLPHTTRAALTGLRKRGYPLVREAVEGGSVYRIAADTTSAAAA